MKATQEFLFGVIVGELIMAVLVLTLDSVEREMLRSFIPSHVPVHSQNIDPHIYDGGKALEAKP